MFKKLLFIGAGGLLVLGLMFGRNLVPYAGTAVSKVQSWAEGQVETEYKLETARNLLERVEKNIEPMVFQIAQQKVAVERLNSQVQTADDTLAKSQLHIMKLRNHLNSGEATYVSTGGQAYSNSQVRVTLERAFRNFKQHEQKLQALEATLEARQKGLDAAQRNLEATHAKRKELATQIENLEAQLKLLEVARTSSQYAQFDNSDLARTQEMLDEVKVRIDTESTMMEIAPELMGDLVPMEDETESEDIIEAVDAYFGNLSDDVVSK